MLSQVGATGLGTCGTLGIHSLPSILRIKVCVCVCVYMCMCYSPPSFYPLPPLPSLPPPSSLLPPSSLPPLSFLPPPSPPPPSIPLTSPPTGMVTQAVWPSLWCNVLTNYDSCAGRSITCTSYFSNPNVAKSLSSNQTPICVSDLCKCRVECSTV